jgi:outer membrane protein assembly factor BamB
VTGAFTAPVIDADPDAQTPWLATAYLPGMSLQEAVQRHGPLPLASVWALAGGLAEALQAIHRAGVVHRDLTPANVILLPDGPRVIDFGIAREAEASALTRTGGLVGASAYVPPEQVLGQPSGPPGDLFSYGAVLFHAATGALPFGDVPAHVQLYRVVNDEPELTAITDDWLRDLIANCLAKDPARRPPPERILAVLGPTTQRLAAAGTRWLPDPVAADIAERAQVAARLPVPSPTFQSADETARGRRVSRRTLLAASAGVAGFGVLAAAGAGAYGLGSWLQPNRWTFAQSGKMAVAAQKVFVATEDNGLYTLDAESGRTLWNEGLTYSNDFDLTVADGIVFASTNRNLSVFRASDGGNPWTAVDSVNGPSTVAGDALYYAASTELTAIDARTGNIRWQYVAGNLSLEAPPVVSGSLVGVFDTQGTVSAVDVQRGQAVWTYPANVQSVSTGALLADANRFYFGGGDGSVTAIVAKTGKRAWTAPSSGGAPPVLLGDAIYLGAVGGVLTCYDAATGKQRWAFGGAQDPHPQLTGGIVPVLSQGVLCFYGSTSKAYGISAATGKQVWDCRLAGTGTLSTAPPPVVNGVAYLLTDKLVALDVHTGKEITQVAVGELPELAVAGTDTIYVQSEKSVTAVKTVR